MPVVRTPPMHSFGIKHSPYDIVHYSSRIEKAPFVRIHSPSLDISFVGHLSPYEALEDNHFTPPHWMNIGPLLPEPEVYESAPCPPSFTSTPEIPDSLEEPLDGSLFHWPYEGHSSGSESSFTMLASHSSTFSPTTSLVSCSPRSDHSLSLSPQPEPLHTFKFDYSLPNGFPSSSPPSTLPLSHSPKSSATNYPTSSRSGTDSVDKKRKSRDDSPSHTAENDARRRFPCLVPGCGRRFTSQYTLKVHREAHNPKPRSSYPCELGCNERFSRQHDRLRHEVAKHNKVCPYTCDDCSRFFSTERTLGNHKCPVAQGGTRWVTS